MLPQVLHNMVKFSLEAPDFGFKLIFNLYNFFDHIVPENDKLLKKYNRTNLVQAIKQLNLSPLYSRGASKHSHDSGGVSPVPSNRGRSGRGPQDGPAHENGADVPRGFISDAGVTSALADLGYKIEKDLLSKVGPGILFQFQSFAQTCSQIYQATPAICGVSKGS